MLYLNTNSIFNRMDPRLKIVLTLTFILFTFFISNLILLTLFLMIMISLVILAGLPISYSAKKLANPTSMIVVMLILQSLIAPHGNVIFEIGFIQVTDDAIRYGALVFIRLMIVIINVVILKSTTKQREVILSLESFLLPVRIIGLKTDSIMLIFKIVGRFVPSITEEAKKTLNAQATRGLDIKGANIWLKMRLIGALLLPVFVVAIKRADDLSNSMAVRGYVSNNKRTSYRALRKG